MPTPSAPTERSPSILFLHLPKTAGMSLRGLFVKNYRGVRHFNTELVDMTPDEWQTCRERLQGEGVAEKYGVFKGHMPFGLHRMIPGCCRYITFLREPVDRSISHYRMLLRQGKVPLEPAAGLSNPAAFLERLQRFPRFFDNCQVRLISGADPALPFGACTKEHLQQALANLDSHFDFVGLTERFDLSLTLLRRVCGWRWIFYVPDNVAPLQTAPAPRQLAEAMRRVNVLDLELYRQVAKRFEQTVERFDWRLHAEEKIFTWGNARHQQLHRWRQARKARRGDAHRPAMRRLGAGQPG
jgi:hypothetical protein